MAMNIRNPNDIMTDAVALGPSQMGDAISSFSSYNKPGLPKPPAGWGKVIGLKDTFDSDDEGPESPDQLKD